MFYLIKSILFSHGLMQVTLQWQRISDSSVHLL